MLHCPSLKLDKKHEVTQTCECTDTYTDTQRHTHIHSKLSSAFRQHFIADSILAKKKNQHSEWEVYIRLPLYRGMWVLQRDWLKHIYHTCQLWAEWEKLWASQTPPRHTPEKAGHSILMHSFWLIISVKNNVNINYRTFILLNVLVN